MKKRIIAAFLMTILCSGCVGGLDSALLKPKSTEGQTETDGNRDTTGPSGSRSVKDRAEIAGPAKYTLIQDDRSVYDDDGETILSMYYERVELDPVNDNYKRVNRLIQDESDEFLKDADQIEEDVLENPPVYDGACFSNFINSRVTYNKNGILSIETDQEWFMGGVYNIIYGGHTYDLTTGKELSLSDIFDMDYDDIGSYIKEQSKNYVRTHPDMSWWDSGSDSAENVIDGYALDSFKFYIEDSNVIICYPPYDLGPGVLGPILIPCPIINSRIPVGK